jgi:hypothetical protein
MTIMAMPACRGVALGLAVGGPQTSARRLRRQPRSGAAVAATPPSSQPTASQPSGSENGRTAPCPPAGCPPPSGSRPERLAGAGVMLGRRRRFQVELRGCRAGRTPTSPAAPVPRGPSQAAGRRRWRPPGGIGSGPDPPRRTPVERRLPDGPDLAEHLQGIGHHLGLAALPLQGLHVDLGHLEVELASQPQHLDIEANPSTRARLMICWSLRHASRLKRSQEIAGDLG